MDGIVETKSSLKKWVVHITVALLSRGVAGSDAGSVRLFVPNQGPAIQGFRMVDSALYNRAEKRSPSRRSGRLSPWLTATSLRSRATCSARGPRRRLPSGAPRRRATDAYVPGEVADLGDGESITVQVNGDYVWRGNDDQLSGRGQRVFVTVRAPPEFTLENYHWMLFDKKNSQDD